MVSFSNKKIFIWVLVGIMLVGGGIFSYFYFTTEKSLKLIWPKEKEELRAGKTYQIKWKSKKIGKIGIVLIKEDKKEVKWIVKDFPAGKQKYDWSIFLWEEPRQDYKISILEYPWYEGNKIDYSDKTFTILGPKFASCDQLSLEASWLYLPSDFPNLKKVFITENSFTGDLGGLEGADEKCQQEAKNLGLKGNWKAFLGDDKNLAVNRLNLDGIFVQAPGEGILAQERIPVNFWKRFKEFLKTIPVKKEEKEMIEKSYTFLDNYFLNFVKKWEIIQDEKTCHRFLGKNFEEFFKKFSNPLVLNQEKFDENFLKDLSNLWLGRINENSKEDCITIFNPYLVDESLKYSFTTTCQNWKTKTGAVAGYPPKADEKIEFPVCYTPEGKRINAIGLGGLSSGLITQEEKTSAFTPYFGKSCNTYQKLLCIEQ